MTSRLVRLLPRARSTTHNFHASPPPAGPGVRSLHLPPPPAPLRASRFLARGRHPWTPVGGRFSLLRICAGAAAATHIFGEVRLWHVYQDGGGGSRFRAAASAVLASRAVSAARASGAPSAARAHAAAAAALLHPARAAARVHPSGGGGCCSFSGGRL